MVDRFPPRHGEYHDIDEDDGAIRDWNPMLSEGEPQMSVYGLLVFRYPDDKRIEVKRDSASQARLVMPLQTYPACEVVIPTAHIPQLITDLKRATGDTDDGDRVRIDRPDSDSGGGDPVPADDARKRGESGGPGT